MRSPVSSNALTSAIHYFSSERPLILRLYSAATRWSTDKIRSDAQQLHSPLLYIVKTASEYLGPDLLFVPIRCRQALPSGKLDLVNGLYGPLRSHLD
jgi:hypothetical protein